MDAQTSVATSFQYDAPIERQLLLIAEAGFSHLSLGARPEHSGYLETARRKELKTRMADAGIALDTIHARALHYPGAAEEALATLEAAAELGARFMVAHAGPFHCGAEGLAERLAPVLADCGGLAPAAEATGVLIAPLARAIIGGLATSVFLTVYIVPAYLLAFRER
jgi:sugar phosphate isomerase/epimerase